MVGEDREVLIDRPGRFGVGTRMLIEHAEHVSFCWRPDTKAHASVWPVAGNNSNSVICLNAAMKDFAQGKYHSSSLARRC